MKHKRLRGEFYHVNSRERDEGELRLYACNHIEKAGLANLNPTTGCDIIHFNGIHTIIDESTNILGHTQNSFDIETHVWLIENQLIKDLDKKSISHVELVLPLLKAYGIPCKFTHKFGQNESFIYFRKYILTLITSISFLLFAPIPLKYGRIKMKNGKNMEYVPFHLYSSYATGGVIWDRAKLIESEEKEIGIKREESDLTQLNSIRQSRCLYLLKDIGGIKGLDDLVKNLISDKNEKYHCLFNYIAKSMYYVNDASYDILMNRELLLKISKLILRNNPDLKTSSKESVNLGKAEAYLYDKYLDTFELFTSKSQFTFAMAVVREWRNKVGHLETLQISSKIDARNNELITLTRSICKIIFAIFLLKDMSNLSNDQLGKISERDLFIHVKQSLSGIREEEFEACAKKLCKEGCEKEKCEDGCTKNLNSS